MSGSEVDAAAMRTPATAWVSLAGWFDRMLDRLVGVRLWAVWTALAASVTSVIMAGPGDASPRNDPGWAYILRKSHDLLYEAPKVHLRRESSLTFRLTVPAIAKVLHFNSRNDFIVMQVVFAVLLLLVFCLLVNDVIADKGTAVLLTFALALTPVGNIGFVDLRSDFDVVGFFFLTLAAWLRQPVLIAAAAFAACWCDERAVVACGLVFLFHVLMAAKRRDADARPQPLKEFFDLKALAVVAGVVGYAVVRVFLTQHYGLKTPTDDNRILKQINLLGAGLWTPIEGLWVLIGIGGVALWQARRRPIVALAMLVSLILCAIGLAVTDVTRATGYLYPLVFVALAGVVRLDRAWVRRALLVVMLVCFITPNYSVASRQTLSWQRPWPTHLITGSGDTG